MERSIVLDVTLRAVFSIGIDDGDKELTGDDLRRVAFENALQNLQVQFEGGFLEAVEDIRLIGIERM